MIYAARSVRLKFVYFGPRDAGVSTNCDHITPARHRRIRGIADRHERLPEDPFEYDFPGLGRVGGFEVRGWFFDRAPSTLTLGPELHGLVERADAVAFIADSRAARLADNVEAARVLLDALAATPVEKAGRPIALQLNRRDDSTALPVGELVSALGLDTAETIEAVASEGRGVRPTIVAMLRPLLVTLKTFHART